MIFVEKLAELRKKAMTQANELIFCQLEYALQLNKYSANKFEPLIQQAIDMLYQRFVDTGAITKQDALSAQQIILPLSSAAKKQTVICVAHAHIDMNWMWGYDETVAITLSTIETMLNLLDDYYDFTFSQSQASVYKIVETYRPDLIERIKRHIKLGKWEVTAGAYVECDKNMPSLESQIGQIKQTKQYLSKLLDISADSLVVDFEPDTFGHNDSVPSILANGGIKYYYHCRGNDMPPIYRWSANQSSILVYREPLWYNSAIDNLSFLHTPDFCDRYKLDTALKVYGVGDHGGGATAKDIEKIIQLSGLPVMPTIKFGSYKEFFTQLEKVKDIPQVKGEQNAVFTGCYSSQSKIKQGNFESEKLLYNANLLCAVNNQENSLIKTATINTLFNQFHDILPGSCKESTRNFALALNQQTKAICGSAITQALNDLGKKIDTSKLLSNQPSSNYAQGAGGGFNASNGNFAVSMAGGSQRAFVLVNSLNVARDSVVNLEIWDYDDDINNLEAVDCNGNQLDLEVEPNIEAYWSHNVNKAKVLIKLAPLAYTTIVVKQKSRSVLAVSYPPLYERQEVADNLVLENDLVTITLNKDMSIVSFIDKTNNQQLIDAPSTFRYVVEDGSKFMSAWVVGRIDSVDNITSNIRLLNKKVTALCSSITYSATFATSNINVTYSLDKNSATLKIDAKCDFFDKGVWGTSIPRLEFNVNPNREFSQLKSISPLNMTERASKAADFCSLNAVYKHNNDCGLLLAVEGKYGFRNDDGVSVCLLRASYDPDPLPEYGQHQSTIYLAPIINDNNAIKNQTEMLFNAPYVVSVKKHEGKLAPCGQLFNICSKAVLSKVYCEDNSLFIRLANLNSTVEKATLTFSQVIVSARLADINNNQLNCLPFEKNSLTCDVNANDFITIKLSLGGIN